MDFSRWLALLANVDLQNSDVVKLKGQTFQANSKHNPFRQGKQNSKVKVTFGLKTDYLKAKLWKINHILERQAVKRVKNIEGRDRKVSV